MKVIYVLLMLVLVLTACTPSLEWVEFEGIQCQEKPWITYWFENYGQGKEFFGEGLSEEENINLEIEMIKEYYRTEGVEVYNAELKILHRDILAQCDASDGSLYRLLVKKEDSNRVKELLRE